MDSCPKNRPRLLELCLVLFFVAVSSSDALRPLSWSLALALAYAVAVAVAVTAPLGRSVGVSLCGCQVPSIAGSHGSVTLSPDGTANAHACVRFNPGHVGMMWLVC